MEAYRHLLPPKRYPLAVLYLELPGVDVDQNVHPTKTEVRFRIPGLVYALFHPAIRRAGAGAEGPGVRGQGPEEQQGLVARGEGLGMAHGFAAEAPAPYARTANLPARTPLGAPSSDGAQRRFDLWPTVAPASQSTFAPSAPQSTLDIRNSTLPAAASTFASPFRVLGQAGGSYIVLEDDSGVKLIDQHALHERVLFELFLVRAQAQARGDSQGLLSPVILDLNPMQNAVYTQNDAAQSCSRIWASTPTCSALAPSPCVRSPLSSNPPKKPRSRWRSSMRSARPPTTTPRAHA